MQHLNQVIEVSVVSISMKPGMKSNLFSPLERGSQRGMNTRGYYLRGSPLHRSPFNSPFPRGRLSHSAVHFPLPKLQSSKLFCAAPHVLSYLRCFCRKKLQYLHFPEPFAYVPYRYRCVGFGVGKPKTCRFCHHLGLLSQIDH